MAFHMNSDHYEQLPFLMEHPLGLLLGEIEMDRKCSREKALLVQMGTEGTQSQCFTEWERSIQFGIEMSVITKWREKRAIPFNPYQIDGKSLLLLVCML